MNTQIRYILNTRPLPLKSLQKHTLTPTFPLLNKYTYHQPALWSKGIQTLHSKIWMFLLSVLFLFWKRRKHKSSGFRRTNMARLNKGFFRTVKTSQVQPCRGIGKAFQCKVSYCLEIHFSDFLPVCLKSWYCTASCATFYCQYQWKQCYRELCE